MGWNSPPSKLGSVSSGSSGSITSPLRIAKRDSPQVARRSSSSYKHVRNNNLVSKSPFKSQIPTPSSTPSRPTSVAFPSPRRVSGEKRPRPSSMHEQAEDENDRPFSFKRERRQSKTFQGLLQKEPVTRSPFKQHVPSTEDPASAIPPTQIRINSRLTIPSSLPATTPATPVDSPPPVPTMAPSPLRSSLVSRRMHGPRLSGGGGKKGRGTRVRFADRCDVVEFDHEETHEEASDDDEYGDGGHGHDPEHHRPSEEDPFFIGGVQGHTEDLMHERDENTSYENIDLSDADVHANNSPTLLGMALDPDTSISGLVDEMLFSSNAGITNPTLSIRPSHLIDDDEDVDGLLRQVIVDNPTNLETDDVFGESLHSDGFFRQHHRSHLPSPPARASPHRWTPPEHSSPHQHYVPESQEVSEPIVVVQQGPALTPPRRKPVPPAAGLSSITEDASSAAAAHSPILRSPPHFDVDDENSATPPHRSSIPLDRAQRARQENTDIDSEMLPEMLPHNISPATDANRAEELVLNYEHQNKLQGSFVLSLLLRLRQRYIA